jgi:HEAT repeat protein
MRRNLRRNLMIAFVTTLTLIIAVSVGIVRKHLGYYEVYDPTPIRQELTRVSTWMQFHAPALAQQFQPPADRAQIAALAKSRGVTVPEEVYSLYTWHNGAAKGTALFSEYRFLPVVEAFAYGDTMHKAYPAEPYRLPLFRSNISSAVYTADCLPAVQWETRVQFVYNGSSTQTDSLTDFLSALNASFENGAFEFSASKGLETKPGIFERSFLDMHDERKRAVKLILEGLPDRVTPDEEMAGYNDLLDTQNSQAEKFILLAADRWSVDEDYSFTTMNLLARLDTPAAWETLQKLARNLNPSVRKRAYAMVAFYWPADGRRLNAATEDSAIQDLTADTFDNRDRRLIVRTLRRAPDTWVPAVVTALSNPEKDTRIAAAQTLGFLADPRAAAPLLAQVANEPNEDVRAACYHALADLGNATGEQQLLAAMEKSDPFTLDHARQNGSPAARRLAQQLLASRSRDGGL